jgi:hypothetical protein
MLGDRGSIDTLRRARSLTGDSSQKLRLTAREVWLRVRFAVPDSLKELAAARDLADSLLRQSRGVSTGDASVLLSLAVLTGQVRLVPSLAGKASPPSVVGVTVPPSILQDALATQVYAALGGPTDSLRKMADRVEEAIRNVVAVGSRRNVRQGLLSRAAMLAFPAYRFTSLDSTDRAGDPLLEAQAAFSRGDTASVRRLVDALSRGRQGVRAADVTFDAILPEAWLLAAIGDINAATQRLDPTLGAIRSSGPTNIEDFTRAASLVRAMQLRAELARCSGDPSGRRRWEAAALALWPPESGNNIVPYATASRARDSRSLSHVLCKL